MNVRAALAALVVALAVSAAQAEPIAVSAARMPLYPKAPSERRAGELIYRGGLVLTSPAKAFGGLSDFAVSADGTALLAISDEAHWLRAALTYDASGDLSGMDSANLSPMLNRQGAAMQGKEGDAEAMTLERPHDLDGPVLVSFERDVRVWRYETAGTDAPPTDILLGPWVKMLHDNAQVEALMLLKPDTLLAVGEMKVDANDDMLAALETYPGTPGAAQTHMLSVIPHEPFAITSAANAPGGGVFLLERRFSLAGGVGTELRYVPADDIHEGARLDGRVLMNLSMQDSNIDNMEGVATRTGPNGETFIYILSDDNYSPLERTLLLMFELRK